MKSGEFLPDFLITNDITKSIILMQSQPNQNGTQTNLPWTRHLQNSVRNSQNELTYLIQSVFGQLLFEYFLKIKLRHVVCDRGMSYKNEHLVNKK